MTYYLKHYFDPDFDFRKLAPRERADGGVDHYDLGYVQNVKKGQVLAEWVEIPRQGVVDKDGGGRKPVFSMDRKFPMGANTEVDPDDPGRLLASARGYVYYDDEGLISVKTTLNVRSDVDFHTGNINFGGNVVIHGDVRSGFKVHGHDVLVRGCVDAALIRADASMAASGGVKGGHKAVLKASRDMRLPFAENAMLLSRGALMVDVAVMHCDVFAGDMAVRGKLVGGTAWCTRTIRVAGQIGGRMGTETNLALGYDAILVNRSHLLESGIRSAIGHLRKYRDYAAKSPELEEEFAPKIKAEQQRLDKLLGQRDEVWNSIRTLEDLESCRVLVPGRVMPGVEISIGGASHSVADVCENVRFVYDSGEIIMESPSE